MGYFFNTRLGILQILLRPNHLHCQLLICIFVLNINTIVLTQFTPAS